MLRDGYYWPAWALASALELPSVNIIPTAMLQPIAQLYMQAPNPLAYRPQLSGLQPQVPHPLREPCSALVHL